jgi:pyruvate,water dikinase
MSDPAHDRGEFDSPTSDDDLWTSANIQEVLPGLVPPLSIAAFASTGNPAYWYAYRATKLLRKEESPRFVGFFHHRAYLNVLATRLIAHRALLSSGDAIEHRFLGGEAGGSEGERVTRETWGFRARSFFPLLRMTRRIVAEGRQADQASRRLEAEVRAIDVARLSDAELDLLRERVLAAGVPIFATHLKASGCAGAGFDIVGQLIRSTLKGETESALPVLFGGLRGVESARISLDLWALSRLAIEWGAVDGLRSGTLDPRSAAAPQQLREAFKRFIAAHGHRGQNEMDPLQPSWRQDPSQVVSLVVSYASTPRNQAPSVLFAAREHERKAKTAAVGRRLRPHRRVLFRAFLRDAQRWVALRELTKSATVRATRCAEFFLPEVARRLAAIGVVEAEADIAFVTAGELSDALRGDHSPLGERVARRRAAFEADRTVRLPERFRGYPGVHTAAPGPPAEELIRGTAVSAGSVTARARVILDSTGADELLPGEVLVAPVTDASWTPMFVVASGIVVDIGSALSHGSTVAREFGLPAVVNVRVGTSVIQTGDLVEVDGSAGTVRILERASQGRAL